MADTLELGESIYLKTPLTKGMVLAFKSRRLDLTPPKIESMMEELTPLLRSKPMR